jgi:hypothetical protein
MANSTGADAGFAPQSGSVAGLEIEQVCLMAARSAMREAFFR